MTDAIATPIENKVVSMLDALQNGAIEVGNQVVKYTPDVIEATYGIIKIDNLQHILSAIILGAVCIIGYNIAANGFNREAKWRKEKERDIGWQGVGYFYGCVSIAISTLLFLRILYLIGDIWTWIGIFNPKLYIAHEIIEKVLGTS